MSSLNYSGPTITSDVFQCYKMAISSDAVPDEIWRCIIGHATDLDGPLRLRLEDEILPPFSPESMTAKRNLFVISRRFHNIVTEFLYESVNLSKDKSYAALDRLLAVHPEYFRFIRRLAVWEFEETEDATGAPEDAWYPFDYIRDYLGHATRVVAVIVHIASFSYGTDVHKLIEAIPESIEYLRWYVRVWEQENSQPRPHHEELVALLTHAPNLRSFGMLMDCTCAQELLRTSFKMRVLQCLGFFGVSGAPVRLSVASRWKTPVLTDVLSDGKLDFGHHMRTFTSLHSIGTIVLLNWNGSVPSSHTCASYHSSGTAPNTKSSRATTTMLIESWKLSRLIL